MARRNDIILVPQILFMFQLLDTRREVKYSFESNETSLKSKFREC